MLTITHSFACRDVCDQVLVLVLVPGETGLTRVQPAQEAQEPQAILTLLTIGAFFLEYLDDGTGALVDGDGRAALVV